MENKTISQLTEKKWYRLLKVVFILVFLIILGMSNFIIFISAKDYKTIKQDSTSCLEELKSIEPNTWGYLNKKANCEIGFQTEIYFFNYIKFIKYFLIGNFIVLSIFETIRRCFYYVVFGSLRPEK